MCKKIGLFLIRSIISNKNWPDIDINDQKSQCSVMIAQKLATAKTNL